MYGLLQYACRPETFPQANTPQLEQDQGKRGP